jgi:two-component system, chemotaxis family, protein-glutamate methylesterase/glutaminase
MVRVFLLCQSSRAGDALTRAMSGDQAFAIVGVAWDVREGLARLGASDCDVVLVDTGENPARSARDIQAILQARPLPVIALQKPSAGSDVRRGLIEAGAVAVLEELPQPGEPRFEARSFDLRCALQALSEVKVMRRPGNGTAQSVPPAPVEMRRTSMSFASTHGVQAVAIGASAGGTEALRQLFAHLRKPLPAPVFIVQHIASGHIRGLARWLSEVTNLAVAVADHGALIQPQTVYLAPDDLHMAVTQDHHIELHAGPLVEGFRPSIDVLFRSVLDSYGSGAAVVLLSGMGTDGAGAMKLLKNAGAVTIAQDRQSSIIHGIPGEAIRLDAACHIMPPQDIGPLLRALVMRGTHASFNAPVPVRVTTADSEVP